MTEPFESGEPLASKLQIRAEHLKVKRATGGVCLHGRASFRMGRIDVAEVELVVSEGRR